MVTVYGLEALNTQLVCRIRVVDGDGYAGYRLFEEGDFADHKGIRP